MKQEFIEFLNALIAAAPEVANEKMTDNVKAYIDALTDKKAEKPALTDNGKLVLKYMQSLPAGLYKAKDIAEGMFVASRNVSGAMRKLVTDEFVEKVGESPVLYSITEKGKNFKIED
jgi:DNA-binding MarR family transcriptional regulator